MKTVLVVEDEKMIRKGIKAMIQRSGVPIEVIIECNNGEMALEILKEQEIDVMLTDIRMPKMDGITLVRQMQKLKPIPITVAISGYDEFSYAAEMMKLGVREYILKPVDRDKVFEKLDREIEDGKKMHQEIREIGYQQLKYLLLAADMTQSETVSNSDVFEQYLSEEEFRVCCIEASDEFESGENYIYLNNVGNNGVFILKESNLGLLLKNELKFANAGISMVHKGIFSLKTAYEEAVKMRQTAFCMNNPCLIFEEEKEEKKWITLSEKLAAPESKLQRVQLLGTDKTEEIADQWSRIFIEVRKGRINWKLFEELIHHFLDETQKTYRNIIFEETERPKELKDILKYNNILTYEEKFMEWTLGLHEKINSQFAVNKNKQKINQAIHYINKNYAKDLNMAVVSNYISMNYSLFSYSFKQFIGSNFVDYLKNLRISEAQHLLKETEMRVNEISQAVGYENEKHFMKLFKNTCGVSPSEYRKNMQH